MPSSDQNTLAMTYAAEGRKLEVNLFWQRSLFYWGFIGAAFVAYGVLFKETDRELALVIACFGFVCSVVWTLGNRGSKYWYEAWEQKVQSLEGNVLGQSLFHRVEPVKDPGWLSGCRYSVSKLTIALSDFTVAVWAVLAFKAWTQPGDGLCLNASALLLTGTILYVGLILWFCRSKAA